MTAREKLLSPLKVGPAKTPGWYVRCEWMEPKSGKIEYYAGPFLEEAHGIAFWMFNNPDKPMDGGRWETEDWDARMVSYYDELAAERRGVEEARLVLPHECRLVRKGWSPDSKPADILAFCLEEAVKLLKR